MIPILSGQDRSHVPQNERAAHSGGPRSFQFIRRTYFSSTSQYAESRNDCHDWYFRWVSFMAKSGLRFGFSGLRMSAMCACRGVRPPFLTLQSTHAHTMFSHVVRPFWARGMTWSRLSSLVGNFFPQYWHWLWSRAKMFRRLNLTVCFGTRSYSSSRITRGAWISQVAARTQSSSASFSNLALNSLTSRQVAKSYVTYCPSSSVTT